MDSENVVYLSIDVNDDLIDFFADILPYSFFIFLLISVFAFLRHLFHKSIINSHSSFSFNDVSKTDLEKRNDLYLEKQKDWNLEKKQYSNFKKNFYKTIDNKLDLLYKNINNSFNDFDSEFYLLKKSIKLKKETYDLSKLLEFKKFNNINKLTLLKK